MTKEERLLIKREQQLLRALASRRTPSQRQAAMATGDESESDEYTELDDRYEGRGDESTSARQARMALRAGQSRPPGRGADATATSRQVGLAAGFAASSAESAESSRN
jgi:hypothetical protein